MRVAVLGTGAMGGFFGGMLGRAGHEVTFIARGAHLEAIRAHGLAIKSTIGGDFTASGSATDDPAKVGAVDLVLVGVKAYDLDEAAQRARPLVGPRTVVLPLQNGVDIVERLGRVLGDDRVLGGISFVGGKVEAPGVIRQSAASGATMLALGEPGGGTSPRVEQLVAALQQAGIVALRLENIQVDLWQKFVMVCANGMTALARLPSGPLLACAESRAMYRGTMEEVVAVGRASGVSLPEGLIERSFELLLGFPPTTRGSMAHDLEAGRRLELETLNGTVVRLGRELGVPTPWNAAIYAALKPFVNGPPG